MEADPADRPSAKDVVEMLSQQVEKPVAGSRRGSRKQVRLAAVSARSCTSRSGRRSERAMGLGAWGGLWCGHDHVMYNTPEWLPSFAGHCDCTQEAWDSVNGVLLPLPQEVGAASGRVLDDLIRHAQVLGMEGFTRSDALATAEYRNDFKQYKCVADLLT